MKLNEDVQCLALMAIANVGGKEFTEALLSQVMAIFTAQLSPCLPAPRPLLFPSTVVVVLLNITLTMSPLGVDCGCSETRPLIRKKAALCALRLFRKYPELLPPEAWTDKVCRVCMSVCVHVATVCACDHGMIHVPVSCFRFPQVLSFMSNLSDLGLLLSVTSFILGYSSKYPEPFEECVGHAIRALSRIVMDKQFRGEYVYFHICNPWLQVKLLRLLQYYPPPEDQMLLQMVSPAMSLSGGGVCRSLTT